MEDIFNIDDLTEDIDVEAKRAGGRDGRSLNLHRSPAHSDDSSAHSDDSSAHSDGRSAHSDDSSAHSDGRSAHLEDSSPHLEGIDPCTDDPRGPAGTSFPPATQSRTPSISSPGASR